MSNAIKQVRAKLNELGSNKVLSITAQCGTVYQGVSVPDPSLPNQYYNHLVYIINTADAYIDFYQVKAYDDWYEYPGGSLEYLQNIYLNWRNFQGMSQWGSKPLSNFQGVAADKLVLGVLGSTSAGSATYYTTPSVLVKFKAWLSSNNYGLRGFMVWDSAFDSKNANTISNTVWT